MSSSPATDLNTPESNEFLQRRVALLGKVLTILWFLVQVVAFTVAVTKGESVLTIGRGLGVAATAVAAVMWLSCRSAVRSRHFVRWVEAVCFITPAVLTTLMGRHYLPRIEKVIAGQLSVETTSPALSELLAVTVQNQMTFTLMLALGLSFTLRAALVPSTALRTTVLTGSALVPLVAISVLGVVPFEADRMIREVTPPQSLIALVILVLIWWTATTVVCATTSWVIYSLRRTIQKAMQLGRYTLLDKLGEGGMGVVYRARHAMMRRPTAVKLLPPEKAGEASLARFEREVQLTAQLTHPNTITIYDYGRTPEGVFYYAMEYLEGATLEAVVEHDGAQPPARVRAIISMVAGALAEAHDIGLIHRDIKPANIILCQQGGELGVAKVLDFGLVKAVDSTNEAALTQEGTITGTPMFMAPEALLEGSQVDGRSDLYALGATAYYLLTGNDVFTGKSVMEICSHHIHSRPVPPSEALGAKLPTELEKLILDCLEKDATKRPASARELRARLDTLPEVGPWTRQDAQRWWDKHGQALGRDTESSPDIAFATTLAVDLNKLP